jgi:vacuolar-type H+-ATPase catalytic subunit A/Vma1
MASQSPILVGIDNDSKEIVEELKQIDDRLREQNKLMTNLKERTATFKDKELKAAWEEQVVNMEYIHKEDKALIGVMQEVKSLYLQKKKFMTGGGICPPEIQSKLIDKVLDYKKEKMRVKEEIEDINDEFQKILQMESAS